MLLYNLLQFGDLVLVLDGSSLLVLINPSLVHFMFLDNNVGIG